MLSYFNINSQLDSITYYKEQVINIRNSNNFTPRDTTYISLLNTLSTKYKYINPDTLGILSDEALALSRSVKYNKGEIIALSNLAIFELIRGRFKKSLEYNQEAIQSLIFENSPELTANVYNIMGQAFFSLDNHPEAYKHFRKALLLANKIKI